MQLVIDIPEKDVPKRQELMTINLHFIAGEVCECSYPYKVLPKEHGRLIDEDILCGRLRDSYLDSFGLMRVEIVLKNMDAVIEADGGDTE